MAHLSEILLSMRDDLLENVQFPAGLKTQTGAPRVGEFAATLPMLNIFSHTVSAEPLTTDGETTWTEMITVGLYTSVMESLETGLITDEQAAAHLDLAEEMENQILTWNGFVPGIESEQLEPSVTDGKRGKVRGGVLGTEIHLSLVRTR